MDNDSIAASPTLEVPPASRRFGAVDLALVGMTLIWGFNFVVIKTAMNQISPMAFMVLRFVIASVAISVVVWARQRSFGIARADWAWIAFLGVLGTGIYQPLFMNGLARTSASNTALILAATPAFIVLFNRLLGRERLARRGWLGIAFSFLGILLIVESTGGLSLSSATLLGDLLILAAAICWSLYSVFSAPVLQKYPPLSVTASAMLIGTLMLLVIGMPAVIAQPWAQVDARSYAGLFYSGLFAIATAYVIWNVGVQRIGTARTAIYSNLTPVIAAFAAAIFLNEPITPLKVAGAVVIFVGLYLARTASIVLEPEG